jgi:hypothetical protein
VARLGVHRAGSEGTTEGTEVALGTPVTGQRVTGVAGRRVLRWHSWRWTSAPTTLGGEARAAATAWLGGGGGGSAWGWQRRVGRHEWQMWARPGTRVDNIYLTYDNRIWAIVDKV